VSTLRAACAAAGCNVWVRRGGGRACGGGGASRGALLLRVVLEVLLLVREASAGTARWSLHCNGELQECF